MNKFKFILSASIAAVLTLSCSNNDVDDPPPNGKISSSSRGVSGSSSSDADNNRSSSSSSNISSSSQKTSSSSNENPSEGYSETETYNVEYDENNFKYTEVIKQDYCGEGGILETDDNSYENYINYSIEDSIMVWEQPDYSTLDFKGTLDDIMGTWTRTIDKATSCDYDEEYDYYYYCNDGWNITKAVFTNETVSITRNICLTKDQYHYNGEEWWAASDWTIKVVDCNTLEISDGSNKLTHKITKTGEEYSYKGSTCKYNEPSKTKKEAACKEAWNSDEDYEDILRKDYYSCLKGLLPEVWGEGEGEGEGEGNDDDDIVAKAKAKAKTKTIFKPLLKKK